MEAVEMIRNELIILYYMLVYYLCVNYHMIH